MTKSERSYLASLGGRSGLEFYVSEDVGGIDLKVLVALCGAYKEARRLPKDRSRTGRRAQAGAGGVRRRALPAEVARGGHGWVHAVRARRHQRGAASGGPVRARHRHHAVGVRRCGG